MFSNLKSDTDYRHISRPSLGASGSRSGGGSKNGNRKMKHKDRAHRHMAVRPDSIFGPIPLVLEILYIFLIYHIVPVFYD